VAFSSDGTLVASGSGDKIVRLWRVSDGGLLRALTYEGLATCAKWVAFRPNGRLVAVSDGKAVRFVASSGSHGHWKLTPRWSNAWPYPGWSPGGFGFRGQDLAAVVLDVAGYRLQLSIFFGIDGSKSETKTQVEGDIGNAVPGNPGRPEVAGSLPPRRREIPVPE
jgi:hypothetical protein